VDGCAGSLTILISGAEVAKFSDGLDYRGSDPGRSDDDIFFFATASSNGSGAHPASYPTGIGG